LPASGRIDCVICHGGRPVEFDKTRRISPDGDWRITANPLAWGNPNAEVVVLGSGLDQHQNATTATSAMAEA
jgi:hypothetical protein